MTRPAFNYREYVAGWRAICQSRRLDPRTGYALETETVYRFDTNGHRTMDRVPVLSDPEPECLVDEANANWWVTTSLWSEIGPNHSAVEAEALASIAAQVRRIAGVPDVEAAGVEAAGVDYAIRPSVRAEIAALADDGAGRPVQAIMPLRDIHAKRGETVMEVAGLRMLVPVKVA